MRLFRKRKKAHSDELIIPTEIWKEIEEGVYCQMEKEIKEEEAEKEFVFGNDSKSGIDERSISEWIESWRVLLTHARSWTIAILGIIAGIMYAAASVITGDGNGLPVHSIISTAPYFISAIWSFDVLRALRMYYFWPNPLLVSESLNIRVDHTTGPERLLAILSWQFGVGAAVVAILDSLSMHQSWVTITSILVFGVSAGVFTFNTWAIVDIQKGSELADSYASSGIRWSSKGSTVQQDWQVFWTRRSILAAGVAPLVLLLAWQLDGRIAYLELGYLAYAALYAFQSWLWQYGRMVESTCALEMLAKRSSAIRHASKEIPDSREGLLTDHDSGSTWFGFDGRNN